MHFIIVALLGAVGLLIAFSPAVPMLTSFEARQLDRETWIAHSGVPQRTGGIIGLPGRDSYLDR